MLTGLLSGLVSIMSAMKSHHFRSELIMAFFVFCFLSFIKFHCDMLPPLKSLILKWGLLAQWLYWAKYLQAILACPAILLPGHGHFFIFLLSGYGQFMLSTSFSPLRGCWLLHYDLCPSHFHTHSDRLQVGNCWCVCIAYHGRIIPACCIVNYL